MHLIGLEAHIVQHETEHLRGKGLWAYEPRLIEAVDGVLLCRDQCGIRRWAIAAGSSFNGYLLWLDFLSNTWQEDQTATRAMLRP